MPVNNCKTLKYAIDYCKKTSASVNNIDKSYGFECFIPLEAKDISELMLMNDPVEGLYTKMKSSMNTAPKEVIFSPPATIVYWQDGSRTVVKCSEEDEFSEEMGFVLCFMKKWFGNTGKFNDYINDALSGAKRYYPDLSSDVPDFIQQIKDDVLRIFTNALSKKEEVMIDEPGNSI